MGFRVQKKNGKVSIAFLKCSTCNLQLISHNLFHAIGHVLTLKSECLCIQLKAIQEHKAQKSLGSLSVAAEVLFLKQICCVVTKFCLFLDKLILCLIFTVIWDQSILVCSWIKKIIWRHIGLQTGSLSFPFFSLSLLFFLTLFSWLTVWSNFGLCSYAKSYQVI